MKKIVLIPIIVLAVGAGIAAIGWAAGGANGVWFDRLGLHVSARGERGDLVRVDEVYGQGFSEVKVDAAALGRVVLMEGEGFSVRGANYERYGGMRAAVKGGALEVFARDDDGWKVNLGLDELWKGDESFLEITVPKGTRLGGVSVALSAGMVDVRGAECGALSIDNSFGSVSVSGLACDTLYVRTEAGDLSFDGVEVSGDAEIVNTFGSVKAKGFAAKGFAAELDSGAIGLERVYAEEGLKIVSKLGEIELDDVGAGALELELYAGELDAEGVEAGTLAVESKLGAVGIEGLSLTGAGRIESASGGVQVGLAMGEGDLSYELEADTGRVTVDGADRGRSAVGGARGGAKASLWVKAELGGIELRFGR